jgi:hypothetical protein
MLLNYTVNEDDFIAFNIYHAQHMASYKRTILFLYLLVPVFVVAITPMVFMVYPDTSPLTWAAIATAASALWILTTPSRFTAMIRRQVKRVTKEHNKFIGKFSLELCDAEMIYTAHGESHAVAYNSLTKVAEDKGLTYLFLSALTAIVIPPEAFVHESQKKTFFKLLRSKCPDTHFT